MLSGIFAFIFMIIYIYLVAFKPSGESPKYLSFVYWILQMQDILK